MVARAAPYLVTRRCRCRCQRILPLDAYHIDNEASDGRQAYCPRCKADSTREARWLREYGLRPGRAQRCLELQNNTCPLCGLHLEFGVQPAHLRGMSLRVDHDHDSGEVRGLLHDRCNISPPANHEASARWLSYCADPPMRAAHGGIPLIAPSSGAGDAQLPLLDSEPPSDIGKTRRGPHPKPRRIT